MSSTSVWNVKNVRFADIRVKKCVRKLLKLLKSLPWFENIYRNRKRKQFVAENGEDGENEENLNQNSIKAKAKAKVLRCLLRLIGRLSLLCLLSQPGQFCLWGSSSRVNVHRSVNGQFSQLSQLSIITLLIAILYGIPMQAKQLIGLLEYGLFPHVSEAS